jgi:hypothetical protein
MQNKFDTNLTPEVADRLCDLLLTHYVTDEFFNNLGYEQYFIEIRQKRKVHRLKQWLLEQAMTSGHNEWKEEIDRIEDIVLQSMRDLQGNVSMQILIFSAPGKNIRRGYICISPSTPAVNLSKFGQWIATIAPQLISHYNKLVSGRV